MVGNCGRGETIEEWHKICPCRGYAHCDILLGKRVGLTGSDGHQSSFWALSKFDVIFLQLFLQAKNLEDTTTFGVMMMV